MEDLKAHQRQHDAAEVGKFAKKKTYKTCCASCQPELDKLRHVTSCVKCAEVLRIGDDVQSFVATYVDRIMQAKTPEDAGGSDDGGDDGGDDELADLVRRAVAAGSEEEREGLEGEDAEDAEQAAAEAAIEEDPDFEEAEMSVDEGQSQSGGEESAGSGVGGRQREGAEEDFPEVLLEDNLMSMAASFKLSVKQAAAHGTRIVQQQKAKKEKVNELEQQSIHGEGACKKACFWRDYW